MTRKINFRVTAYNTFTEGGDPKEDRIVARFDAKGSNLQEALDSAHRIARDWNRNEHRPNMIVKYVGAMGTVQEVIQPSTIRNAEIAE